MTTILAHTWDDDEVAEFAASYVSDAALVTWLDHCEEMSNAGVTVDGYAWTDTAEARAHAALLVDPAMRARLDREARRFAAEHTTDLATWFDPDHAGHDLWMNRTGQGTGFWSRYLPTDPAKVFSAYALDVRRKPDAVAEFDAAKERLGDAARALPYAETYVGDDGRIYLMHGDDTPAPADVPRRVPLVRRLLAWWRARS